MIAKRIRALGLAAALVAWSLVVPRLPSRWHPIPHAVVGTAAAIKEAGKTGQVVLVSSGGGRLAAACDNIANDNFTAYLSYDGRGQGRDLAAVVKMLLQDAEGTPASRPFGLYSPVTTLTKDNMAGACWTIEDIKANGP